MAQRYRVTVRGADFELRGYADDPGTGAMLADLSRAFPKAAVVISPQTSDWTPNAWSE